ncbi:MAG: PA2779 family protein [Gallionella sp.]
MNLRLMRITSRLLIASVLSLSLPLQSTHAGMVETEKVASSAQSQSERERINTFLDRADVRKELQTQGIDANTAKVRVAALTDEEVHKVAGKLDKMPAGGSDILGILLTVFIILLITDILGFTKVFPFTRSVK